MALREVGARLFGHGLVADLGGALLRLVDEAARVIRTLPHADFFDQSDEEITRSVAAWIMLEPLQLHRDRAIPQIECRMVEDRSDNLSDQSGRGYVPGFRMTLTVPFSGSPELWRLRPTPYNVIAPCGRIDGCELVIGTDVPLSGADEATGQVGRVLALIEDNIDRQQVQIERSLHELPRRLLPIVRERRRRLSIAAEMLGTLSVFPRRTSDGHRNRLESLSAVSTTKPCSR